MRLTALSALLAAIIPTYAAQPAKAAADEWAEVERLAAPVPVPRTINGRSATREEKRTAIKQQSERARLAAQAAKTFYSRYPSHAKAPVARKTEALSALRGAEGATLPEVDSALTVAKTYRNDRAHSDADRFDVALAIDQFTRSTRVRDGQAGGRIEDWKNVGENLKGEFGDVPALQNYFVGLAERADMAAAVTLATNVVNSAVAPPEAKARARIILDRAALAGSPLAVRVRKSDGSELDLAQQRGNVTVVVAFSAADAGSINDIANVQAILPSGAQIIYLALGGKPGEAKKIESRLPTRGMACHSGTGAAAGAVFAGLKVSRARLPLFYVINSSGLVVGVGRLVDLPQLLARAVR